MRIGSNIESRVSTTLNITPRLQQAIRMLQLSATDLSAFIYGEVETNPLLSVEMPNASLSDGDNSKTSDEHFEDNDYYQDLSAINDDHNYSQNNRLRTEQTLSQYLEQQLSLAAQNKNQYAIGMVLIDQLAPDGYLEIDADEIANILQVEKAEVLETITIMQKFDPVGIFARNIQECLRIQLIDKGLLDDNLEKLLNNLDCLMSLTPLALAKKCNMSVEELQDSLAKLRTLNPRPASGFIQNTEDNSIIPDGFVYKNSNGEFEFELNLETMPKVLLDNDYYQELRSSIKKGDDKQFLQAKFAHANWLIQSLHQRFVTLERVANAIIKKQQAFFQNGASDLKPMTLKMIAEELDVHESTVSRVTTEKYINTPRGTFELKFFFSQSLVSISEGQDDVSAKSVQTAILNLVKKECTNNPLSDEQLAAKLGESGMLIARRTIAKYRNILKIPSSQERKNQYMYGLKKA